MKIRELNDSALNMYLLWSEGLLVSTPNLPDVDVTGDPVIDVRELYDTAAQHLGYSNLRDMADTEGPDMADGEDEEEYETICEEYAVSLIIDKATEWATDNNIEFVGGAGDEDIGTTD